MIFRRKRERVNIKQRNGTCIMTQIKLDMKNKNVGKEKYYEWN